MISSSIEKQLFLNRNFTMELSHVPVKDRRVVAFDFEVKELFHRGR